MTSKRCSLAFVTSSVSGKTNESGLSERLLYELGHHYEICVITEKFDSDSNWNRSEISVQSVIWFEKNAQKFDRIFYVVAASPEYYYMWGLFDKFPGVVLLLNVYVSEALAYRYRLNLCTIESVQAKVYQENGYQALTKFVKNEYDFNYLQQFPMVSGLLQSSLLIIVDSVEMMEEILKKYSKDFVKKVIVIDNRQNFGAIGFRDAAVIEATAIDRIEIVTLADKYKVAIENAYGGVGGDRLRAIQSLRIRPVDELTLRVLSQQLDEQFAVDKVQNRLFLDVSSLARDNLKTGIQRVVHKILLAMIGQPLDGYRIEPVYTVSGARGYFFARKFTQALLEIDGVLDDSLVKMSVGDVFLGLDLCCSDIIEQTEYLEFAHAQGVKILFLVHDLLPVAQPSWFPLGVKSGFEAWLKVISRFDGAICVSAETAKQLRLWQTENLKNLGNIFGIHVCHNGVDRMTELSTGQRSEVAITNFASLKQRPTFLMVGTLEPRKGYSQVLDAFDRLWVEDGDYNLIFVGKEGWQVESLVARVLSHTEYMSRLHWYQDLNDDSLVVLYEQSTCLIAASEGEGFGLPLIEAAQFGLPIIARDIPVFREVAEDAAYFFKASNGAELARVIESWLELFVAAKAPASKHLSYLSWDQCVKNYSKVLQGYFQ
jgi:glycosyltransferase involved in cell wall biosynthesis